MASYETEEPLIWAAFSHLEREIITTNPKSPNRTAVYIDGYNLYYGRLRGTNFKWFDVVKFFDALLAQRDQNECLLRVNLFTAHALSNFATHGTESVQAQSAYHRALQVIYEDRFLVVYGKHSYNKGGSLLPAFVPGQPYDRNNRLRVWKLEEKKTDVNLAVGMYRDACRGLYDRVILVSNDSDAEPVLDAIRQDFPHIMIGVVMPIHPPPPGKTGEHRRVSGSLSRCADWVISNLTDFELEQSQLPAVVPTNKKPIRKPVHW